MRKHKKDTIDSVRKEFSRSGYNLDNLTDMEIERAFIDLADVFRTMGVSIDQGSNLISRIYSGFSARKRDKCVYEFVSNQNGIMIPVIITDKPKIQKH